MQMNASATVYEMRVMVMHITFISNSIPIKYADNPIITILSHILKWPIYSDTRPQTSVNFPAALVCIFC